MDSKCQRSGHLWLTTLWQSNEAGGRDAPNFATPKNESMIKVTDVRIAPERECWEWNGKRYPTLQVGYLVDGKGERRCSDFAAESLWKDMLSAYEAENNVIQKNDIGSTMKYIDEHIYAYVPDYLFNGYSESQIGHFIELNLD